MPLYEYLCNACNNRFEILQRVGAGSESTSCPACGGAELARQLSTFSAAVGGSGPATAGSGGESFGCGQPACGGGTCAGGGDWN